MRTALTIAGSDSIAGAGIQADLKTFSALGVYGVSVVTAVTAQNTAGVSDVFALPADIVRAQIDAVSQDARVAAVKTGMLATGDIVRAVSERLAALRPPHVVVDPVLAAGAGDGRTLLAPDAVSVLKTELLRRATVVTPNLAEAFVLTGVRVESADSALEASKAIAGFGAGAVVIKGGHASGPNAIDFLFYNGSIVELAAARYDGGHVHGTGCTFASAIAARLALGDDIPAAVERAKRYITGAIEHSFSIGRGARILHHFWERTL